MNQHVHQLGANSNFHWTNNWSQDVLIFFCILALNLYAPCVLLQKHASFFGRYQDSNWGSPLLLLVCNQSFWKITRTESVLFFCCYACVFIHLWYQTEDEVVESCFKSFSPIMQVYSKFKYHTSKNPTERVCSQSPANYRRNVHWDYKSRCHIWKSIEGCTCTPAAGAHR